ncbi:MAG: DUF4388 domain-containing protein [Planctomycetota bacterium]
MSSLNGHLEHFGLQELLQTLANGARTGTLQITRDHENVSIVFETGHITFVRNGSASQIRLRSILRRSDLVSEVDLNQARQDQEETGMLLGRALLERGVINDNQLSQALRLKVEEELFDLFLWEHGTFEFFPDLIQPTSEDEINQVTRIQIDPMSVIIEGLRQADEWKIIRERINDIRWILCQKESANPPAESHAIWKLIDGSRSIDEILKLSTGTRFDTCSILYRFLEEDLIREATVGEMLQKARSLVVKNPEASLHLYQALIDRAGESLGHELLEEAADCAAHLDPEAQASFLRRSITILIARGDEPGAWIRLQRLLVLSSGTLEDLQTGWGLRVHIPTKKLEVILDGLLKELRRTGNHRRIIQILREAESMRKGNAKYWLQLGEALQRCDEPEAESCLSKAIQMSKTQNPEIALQAEKILRSVDPNLALDEELIDQLRNRRSILDSSKKVRKGVMAGSLLLLLGVILLHISSEWRAQGLLAAARNIEATGPEISSLLNAAEAFERVATEHPWTFAGNSGASEGTRIRIDIEQRQKSENQTRVETLEKQRSNRLRKLKEVRSAVSRATTLRKEGAAAAAREVLDKLSSADLSVLPEIEINGLKIPVSIQSKPSGARIYSHDRRLIGTSPLTVDLALNETKSFYIERSGCRTKKVQLSGKSPANVLISLVRGPLRTYSLPEAVCQSSLIGDLLITSTRDGKVRLIDAGNLQPLSEHNVGIEGHPAPILVEQKQQVLIVPFSGRPLIVKKNGEVKSFGTIATSPRTAANHFATGWVVGDIDGYVSYLDRNGKENWSYRCKAPISLLKQTSDGDLLIIDQTRLFYRLNSSGKQIGSTVILPGTAVQILAGETVLFQDGKTLRKNNLLAGPPPSTSTRDSGQQSIYGTKSGWAIIDQNKVRHFQSLTPMSCAPLQSSKENNSMWIAGQDGILRLQDPSGNISSEVELGSPAINLHRSSRGRILVTLTDGRLCDVEELQK